MFFVNVLFLIAAVLLNKFCQDICQVKGVRVGKGMDLEVKLAMCTLLLLVLSYAFLVSSLHLKILLESGLMAVGKHVVYKASWSVGFDDLTNVFIMILIDDV